MIWDPHPQDTHKIRRKINIKNRYFKQIYFHFETNQKYWLKKLSITCIRNQYAGSLSHLFLQIFRIWPAVYSVRSVRLHDFEVRLRFHCLRDLVWWVSVWKSADEDMREMKRVRGSPCYFVMHQPDVVLLCLRFDCCRDEVWWVSVKKVQMGIRERWREWEGNRVIS
jgi:hypothetical protein